MKQRHGIVCAVYLLLFNGEKALLLRRFNTGYEDGNYSIPAGHVDEGESVYQALKREVKEEIGIDVQLMDMVHVMHRKGSDTNDERLDFFFKCKTYNGEIKNMEEHKCDDLSFFDANNLPENTIPYIQHAIEKVMQRKSYSEEGWDDSQ